MIANVIYKIGMVLLFVFLFLFFKKSEIFKKLGINEIIRNKVEIILLAIGIVCLFLIINF